ncbi:MAG: diguanylate cyclase [Thermodesulfobacteriota bacterium]
MEINILIVDDDAAIRDSLHEFISMAHYKSYKASSAEEALELLKRINMHVVITDIMLPGLDGLELTDLIKKSYDTDVIVMTGYSGNYSYEEAINKGASDLVFKPVRYKELLLRLKRVLKEQQLTRERIQMLGKLQKLAITDGLTKLYNSRYFYNQVDLEVDRSNRYHHTLSLLLLDIDHFKVYNDTYGHLEGDKVLVRIGEVIKACLRKMDTAYRYGGEEFTVILPETNGQEAIHVAERIRTSIEKEIFSPDPGKEIKITISIGVTEYITGERISALVERADKAMYISKENGRNRISALFQ